jgi:hypothetical protein
MKGKSEPKSKGKQDLEERHKERDRPERHQ